MDAAEEGRSVRGEGAKGTSGGSGVGNFDALAIVGEVRDELSRADRRTLALFYGFADIANLANIRAGRSQFDALGNLSRVQIEDALAARSSEAAESAESEAFKPIPRWMARIMGDHLDAENPERPERSQTDPDETGGSEGLSLERALFEEYYRQCAVSGSDFLRAWSRFDRNLRNVIAACTARGRERPVVDRLVGRDEIVLSLTKSHAADFGLKGELEYIDSLLTAMERSNIVEKERAIDLIRWAKADELAEFDSFGMPTVMAYLVKIGIIHRWMALDPATGREMYEKLVAEMGAQVRMGD